jgi:hypothetical protein
MRYDITLAGPTGENISRTLTAGENTLIERVLPGTWTVTVKAYAEIPAAIDGTHPVVYAGQLRGIVTQTVTVQSGRTAPVQITLGTVTGVRTWAELVAAITNAANNDVIVVQADIEYGGFAISMPANITVTLLAEGNRVISAGTSSYSQGVFHLYSANPNATLILGDPLMPGTLTLRGSAVSGNGALIQFDHTFPSANLTLIMNDKVTLTGNTTDPMDLFQGGAVTVTNGEFIMNGGTITGNTARGYGGGVFVEDGGLFKMAGGTISGNTAVADGGGVFVEDGGLFKMAGGTITGNTASAGIGNAVCVYRDTSYNEGIFSWTGGSINVADIKAGDSSDIWDLKGWWGNKAADYTRYFSPAGPAPADFVEFGAVWTGDGSTAATAIAITSRAELAAIGNNAATLGLCYYLAFDITISGTWTPIGDNSSPFTGSLNGNSYTITFNNPTVIAVIAGTSGQYAAGVFGVISGAVLSPGDASVSYLIVKGSFSHAIDGVKLYMGAITGYIKDGGIIEKCGSRVALTVTRPTTSTDSIYVGGIAGAADECQISDCYYRGNIVSEYHGPGAAAGGIVGYAYSLVAPPSSETEITNCYTSGVVNAGANGRSGGVVGLASYTELSNVVALNSNLQGSSSSTIGRIYGDDFGFLPTVADSYGLTDMKKDGSYTLGTWTPVDCVVNGKHGADVPMDATGALSQTWWTGTAFWAIGGLGDDWWWDDSTPGDEHPELW